MIGHKGTQSIKTKRLLLRKYEMDDATDIYENYATDERVTKFLTWQPYTDIADLRDFIALQISGYADGMSFNWVIEHEKQVIGSISVTATDEKNKSCEIGYCLARHFWNKGIMTEAVSAVIRYLCCEVGFHRVVAKHDVENAGSGKVMEKCGMIFEGRLRDCYLRHGGTFSDARIYSMLSDEVNHAR